MNFRPSTPVGDADGMDDDFADAETTARRHGADVSALKVSLAAHIVRLLDELGQQDIDTHRRFGFRGSDVAKIRSANLSQFSVERLVNCINKLGGRVRFSVEVNSPRSGS